MSLYASQIRQIQQEAKLTLAKLAEGRFSDFATAKGYVEHRKGLLRALEILRQPAKANDDMEDV